jgi:flagellar hook-basal body complex protein FliE
MSSLGKICCVVAIVCSLTAGVLGFLIAKTKSTYGTQLTNTEEATRKFPSINYAADFKNNPDEPAATLNKAAAAAKTALEERNKFKDDLDGAKTKLADSESQVQKLTTDYTAAKKDLDEKTTALTKATTDLQTTSSELKDLKDKLGGRSIDGMIKDFNEATEKAKVVTAEKKIVDDALAKANVDIEKYKEFDRLREAKEAPLDLTGRVVAINKTWNFVVLDVGKDNKLVENVELTVYRGNQMIGKIRTVSVDAKAAIADVIPDLTQGEIQVGDKVLY